MMMIKYFKDKIRLGKPAKQTIRSLVRPTVEYASTVWDPCRQYQIQWLENIQR